MKVTYNAPDGDSKVCEWGSYTFFDGIPVEVEEDSHIGRKLKTNQHFSVKAPRAKAAEKPAEDHDAHAGEVADEPEQPNLFKYPEPVRRRRGGK